jgi:hypothetical protein
MVVLVGKKKNLKKIAFSQIFSRLGEHHHKHQEARAPPLRKKYAVGTIVNCVTNPGPKQIPNRLR